MKRIRKLGYAVLALGLVSVTGGASAEDLPADRILHEMDWLAGHWRGAFKGGTWEAIYSGPQGGLIISLNKHVVDGSLQTFEIEQFRVQDGKLVMAPSPAGKPSPVVFTLTEWDPQARRAVFENPQHDFPQVLTYERVAADRLVIRVHAMREGRRIGFDLELSLRD